MLQAKCLLAVDNLCSEHPDLFHTLPIKVTAVAERLGIKVEQTTALSVRARLHVTRTAIGTDEYRVYVKTPLPRAYARFAVAHEIGHAYFHKFDPKFEKEVGPMELERVCDFFASELLAPKRFHHEIRERLHSINQPTDFTKLASLLDISISALFQVCTHHMSDWFRDSCLVVILASRMRHPKPSLSRAHPNELKERVRVCLHDPDKYFIAKHQGLASVLNPIDWLHTLRQGASTNLLLEFTYSSVRLPKIASPSIRKPKYTVCREIVPSAIFRLSSSGDELDTNYIALLRMRN